MRADDDDDLHIVTKEHQKFAERRFNNLKLYLKSAVGQMREKAREYVTLHEEWEFVFEKEDGTIDSVGAIEEKGRDTIFWSV